MSSKGKIDEFGDLPALEAQKTKIIGFLTEIITKIETAATAANQLTAAFGDSKGMQDLMTNYKKLNDIQGESKKNVDELTRLQEKLKTLDSEQAIEIAKLKDAITNKNKEIKDSVKSDGAATDSLIKMRLEVSNLAQQYAKLSEAERNSAKGMELGKKILDLNTTINTTKKGIGDFTSNVAHYSEGIQDAMQKTGLGNTVLGQTSAVLLQAKAAAIEASVGTKTLAGAQVEAGSGAITLNGAFQLLSKNPWVMVLSMVAVIFFALKDAISRNAEIVKEFTIILEPFQKILGAIFGVIGDVIKAIVEGFTPALNENQKALLAAEEAERNLYNLKILEKKEIEIVNNLMAIANNRLIDGKTRYEALTGAIRLQVDMAKKMATEQNLIVQGQIVKMEDYYNLHGNLVNADMTLTSEANRKMSEDDKNKYKEMLTQLLDYDQKESEIRRESARKIGQIQRAIVNDAKKIEDLRIGLMQDSIDKEIAAIASKYKTEIAMQQIANKENIQELTANKDIRLKELNAENAQILANRRSAAQNYLDAEKKAKEEIANLDDEFRPKEGTKEYKEIFDRRTAIEREAFLLQQDLLKKNEEEKEKTVTEFNNKVQNIDTRANEITKLVNANANKEIKDATKKHFNELEDEILAVTNETNQLRLESIDNALSKELAMEDKNYNDKKIKLEKQARDIKLDPKAKDYDKQLELARSINEALEQLEITHNNKMTFIIEDFAKKQLDLDKKDFQEHLKFLEEYSKNKLVLINQAESKELSDLTKSYSLGEISKKEYEEKKLAIQQTYTQKKLDEAVNAANIELATAIGNNIGIENAKIKLDNAIIASDNNKTNQIITNSEKAKQKQMQDFDKISSYANTFASSLEKLLSSPYDQQLQNITDASNADKDAKDKELKAAGNNAVLKQQINDKYDAKEKQREADRKKVEHDKAVFAKQSAMANILLHTAEGIIKAWMESPTTFGLPWSAAIAIEGGLEEAAAAAVPIPAYKTGIKGKPTSGFADIVEDYKPEVVKFPSGEQFLFTDPTRLFLPAGTDVISNPELMRKAAFQDMASFEHARQFANSLNLNFNTDFKELRKDVQSVASAVKGKKEFHLNITKEGVQYMANEGGNWTEYVNRNYRI